MRGTQGGTSMERDEIERMVLADRARREGEAAREAATVLREIQERHKVELVLTVEFLQDGRQIPGFKFRAR